MHDCASAQNAPKKAKMYGSAVAIIIQKIKGVIFQSHLFHCPQVKCNYALPLSHRVMNVILYPVSHEKSNHAHKLYDNVKIYAIDQLFKRNIKNF